jgi:hypothetical protein
LPQVDELVSGHVENGVPGSVPSVGTITVGVRSETSACVPKLSRSV